MTNENGKASGHSHATLTPADLAVAAVEMQRRGLADAKRIALETVSVRSQAEQAVARAEQVEAAALAASAADRDDADLAQRLTLARTQLEHLRADLRAAIAADKAAAKSVEQSSKRLEAAERAHEAATIEAELRSGHFEENAEAAARAIVAAATVAVDALGRIHDLIEQEGAKVRRLHALGVTGLSVRDGTAAAGFAMRALIEAGAAFELGTNLNEVRWGFCLPGPTNQYATSLEAAAGVMQKILGALVYGAAEERRAERAAESERPGMRERSRRDLRKAAALWPRCRNVGEMNAQREAIEREEVQAKAAADRAAHDERLHRARADAERRKGRAVDQDGRVIGVLPPIPEASEGVELEGQSVPPAPRVPASPVQAARPNAPSRGQSAADRGFFGPGDHVLPGTVDAPGGNAFPTSPVDETVG